MSDRQRYQFKIRGEVTIDVTTLKAAYLRVLERVVQRLPDGQGASSDVLLGLHSEALNDMEGQSAEEILSNVLKLAAHVWFSDEVFDLLGSADLTLDQVEVDGL